MNEDYYDKTGLLHHYFPYENSGKGASISDILAIMRSAYLNDNLKLLRKIKPEMIKKAEEEMNKKAVGLDGPTYHIDWDLTRHIYGPGDLKAFMLVEGFFQGNDNENRLKSVLPIELSRNPYYLFKHTGSTTRDYEATIKLSADFLTTRKKEILDAGYEAFFIEKSRFFYLKEDALAQLLLSNGKVDLHKLVQYLMPNPGHVVLDEVSMPEGLDFLASIPPHYSSRLKKSLKLKLLGKLTLDKRIDLIINPDGSIKKDDDTDDPVADWQGKRIVFSDIHELSAAVRMFNDKVTIGNTTLEKICHKDYYNKPKGDYRAYIIVEKASVPRYDPVIMEVQLLDIAAFGNNEHLKRNLHMEYDKKRRPSRKGKKTVRQFDGILSQIFGESVTPINIRSLN